MQATGIFGHILSVFSPKRQGGAGALKPEPGVARP